VRLLTIAVLQPIVSPLLSISCRLITPYIRPFCFKNDGKVVTLARTAFDASCAAMVPQFLYTHSGLVFRQLREIVRAQVERAGATIRAGCAHRSGSAWAMNVHGYRPSDAALCCGLIYQYRGAHVSQIVVPWSLVVAEPCAWAGARRVARCTARLRFELRGRSAPSCAHCCVRMRIRWTRLPIPVATRLRI